MARRETITAELLRQIMHYDPETGIFTWKVQKGRRVKPGDRSGCPDSLGYLMIIIDRHAYKAHRLAWLYMTGEWPQEIDHINCDRSDNRWANLRLATRSQNGANRRLDSRRAGCLKGASKCNAGWQSKIRIDGNLIYLGTYRTQEEAHKVYCEYAKKHFGAFHRDG